MQAVLTRHPVPAGGFRPWLVAALVFLSGCVTVNIYFPAAAAEKAADRIIQEVWGKPGTGSENKPSEDKNSSLHESSRRLVLQFLDFVLSPAHAQADINVSTPAIAAIKGRIKARHGKLSPLYGAGGVGLTNQGTVAVRDMAAIPLKSRRGARSLVSAENADRAALYQEIARANGHPEWEGQIRGTFAKRWIGNASTGWWYQDGSGAWRQK